MNSHLSNLPTFMVSAQNCNAIPVANFESNQQRDGFQRIISSINIITHEQIVWVRACSTDAKQFGKIIELSVNITTDCDWCIYWLHIRFLLQNFFCLSLLIWRGVKNSWICMKAYSLATMWRYLHHEMRAQNGRPLLREMSGSYVPSRTSSLLHSLSVFLHSLICLYVRRYLRIVNSWWSYMGKLQWLACIAQYTAHCYFAVLFIGVSGEWRRRGMLLGSASHFLYFWGGKALKSGSRDFVTTFYYHTNTFCINYC